MSSHQNECRNNILQENDDGRRVVETKHVLPEDYKCQRCAKKERKCTKPPNLDETISRSIPTNKLNETLRNHKCSHCGNGIGECLCLSDEARKELTKIHEYKSEDDQNDCGENNKNAQK